MTDVRCILGHDGNPCSVCGREAKPVETPAAPNEPGHCEDNPDGDLTEGSSSPYHEYTCCACGEEFNHD